MHVLIQDGIVKQYPYELGDIKKANPYTSFPLVVDDAIMQEFGAHRVFFSTQPVYDNKVQALQETTPVFDTEAGRWTQVWTLRDLTQDEINHQVAIQSEHIRLQRNAKLSATDWTQVIDAPVDQVAWATYRQALRDITNQVGFPWEVQWPTQPE